MKKMIPVKKDRTKDDFKLLSLITKNRGTRAIQTRRLKSNVGKEKMSKKAEARDERIPILFNPGF